MKCLECRNKTYSNYKGTFTSKFMLGISPSGLITYISKAYGGRTSDKQIFAQSEIAEQMIPFVDSIMVDKSFMIDVECVSHGLRLIRPPFLKKKKQLSQQEARETAQIAAARVHVERSIQRIKVFKILHGPIPHHLISYCDKIMRTICGIVNLSAPILSLNKYESNDYNS